MKKKAKKPPKYVYVTGQMEIKYRIMMNVRKKDGTPDWEKFQEFKDAMAKSGGVCPLGLVCQCDEFLNRDKAGPCKMKMFTKVLRDEDAQVKYADDTPKFEDDEAVAKKKRKRREEALETEAEDVDG